MVIGGDAEKRILNSAPPKISYSKKRINTEVKKTAVNSEPEFLMKSYQLLLMNPVIVVRTIWIKLTKFWEVEISLLQTETMFGWADVNCCKMMR